MTPPFKTSGCQNPQVWQSLHKDRSRYDVPLSRPKRDPVVVVFYAIGFVVSGISLIVAITSPWWM